MRATVAGQAHIGDRDPAEPQVQAAINDFGIGKAVKNMQNGERVARRGWNGRDMFLFLVPGSSFKVNRAPLLGIYPAGHQIQYHAHVDMRTVDGTIVPWLCSQSDLLAVDWFIVK